MSSEGKYTNIEYQNFFEKNLSDCLLYTSDAADEQRGVDLGGRRIIKKEKIKNFRLRTQ